MKRFLQACCTLLFATMITGCLHTPKAHAPLAHCVSTHIVSAQSIIDEVNAYRVTHGLTPLIPEHALMAIAAAHSQDMAEERVGFGHSGFHGRMRQAEKAIPGSHAMAENVAYAIGQVEKDTLFNSWIHSPLHLKNLTGPYTYTGVGLSCSPNGKLFATQVFLS